MGLVALCVMGVMIAGCAVTPAVRSSEPPATALAEAAATAPPGTATPEPMADRIRTLSKGVTHSTLESPDGRLRARLLIYACAPIEGEGEYALDEIAISDMASGASWVAAEQVQACGGLGGHGLMLESWSPNSRYLYFSPAREGVPDGCGFWLRPIGVIDVEAREVQELGGGVWSPDGRMLAFWQGPTLVMWDVDHGERRRSPAAVEGVPPGPLAWAPDGSAIAYLQVGGECVPQGVSYVSRVDTSTGDTQTLVASEAPVFGGLAWDAPERITLAAADGKTWEYTLATGVLSPAP